MSNLIQDFSIQLPVPGVGIKRGEVITIITKVIPLENTQYEFYLNGNLIGSSHIPFFSFDTGQLPRKEEFVLQVIANTTIGTFTTEESYNLR